jgi:hypothetical protein
MKKLDFKNVIQEMVDDVVAAKSCDDCTEETHETTGEETIRQLTRHIFEEFNRDTGEFNDHSLSDEQKNGLSEKISKFAKYQQYIGDHDSDKDLAEDVCNIVSSAEKFILNETEDWFDSLSVKRNLKELKQMATEFHKTAKDRQVYTQRMQGLYEDIGHILNRYFDIKELESKDE